jgi:anti-anti-sigma factor
MGNDVHLRLEKRADVTVAYLLDTRIVAELAIASLGDELYSVGERPDCTKLVLNFAAVEYLSSAMLGKLINLNRRMKVRKAMLVLCEIRPEILTIFKLTSLDRILDIRATEADAVAACG